MSACEVKPLALCISWVKRFNRHAATVLRDRCRSYSRDDSSCCAVETANQFMLPCMAGTQELRLFRGMDTADNNLPVTLAIKRTVSHGGGSPR